MVKHYKTTDKWKAAQRKGNNIIMQKSTVGGVSQNRKRNAHYHHWNQTPPKYSSCEWCRAAIPSELSLKWIHLDRKINYVTSWGNYSANNTFDFFHNLKCFISLLLRQNCPCGMMMWSCWFEPEKQISYLKKKKKIKQAILFSQLGRILYEEEYYGGFPVYCYFIANVIYVVL